MRYTLILFFMLLFFICSPLVIDSHYADQLDTYQNNPIFEGYILFGPQLSTTTYLLNSDKDIVHTWPSNYFPGRTVYLLENGNILRTIYLGSVEGGSGGGIQEISWEGELIWQFNYNTPDYLQHHDIEPLPNGNILVIAWEYKTRDEAINAGKDPSKISIGADFIPDHIIEVQPTGDFGGNIVWEWHVWDHLIQDFDPTKDNYGNVAEHPELIDINYVNYQTTLSNDFSHINSIDYNEEFDQILISSRNFNEIWVIDHSTSTEEAAGHTGGIYGKGGDILYRWGNPEAYRAGDEDDKKFYFQHDARWIKQDCPGSGNILLFNNGVSRPGGSHSSIDEIIPPVDENGYYDYTPNDPYGPEEQTWIYNEEIPINFFQSRISGCQRLPDGNTLICEGLAGVFSIVTFEKQKIWEYINPFPVTLTNNVFNVRYYSKDYLNLPPNKPYEPSPGDGDIDIDIKINLSWKCDDFDGDELVYNVYFGVDETPDYTELVSSKQKDDFFNLEELDYDTNYYWRIDAYDNNDHRTEGSIWTFKTKPIITPNADFTWFPIIPKPGEMVNFIDNSTSQNSDIISWQWDFGDGNTSQNQNPNHVYNIEDQYNVSLKINNSLGQTDLISKQINILSIDEEPPIVDIIKPDKGLYFFGNKILKLPLIFIIGKIEIEIFADDNQSGIRNVNIFLNNKNIGNLTERPYKYCIDDLGFGKYELKIEALDNFSNQATIEISIWKFF